MRRLPQRCLRLEWALNEVRLPLLLFFQKSFTPYPFSVLWRVHVGLPSFKLEIMASSSSGIMLVVRDISAPSTRHVVYLGGVSLNMKGKATSMINASSQELYELSSKIWKNPELGFKEYKAHELLTSFLEKKGFAVECSFTAHWKWATCIVIINPCIVIINPWLSR